ncbi:MAG TPA: hypothetical protein VL985_04795 [Stellaceae bacterium]|nr:hypothetical protein [Stellaceae bacterium]
MTEFGGAAILLVFLLGGSALGMFVRPLLSERHRNRETTDLIQLVMTMLVTFAALVLGLLTTSVKESFDTIENDLRSVSIQLIQLNRSLRQYGSEADPARALLRSYVAARIGETWPGQPKLHGEFDRAGPVPSDAGATPGSARSSEMLAQVETDIRGLVPQDAMHRQLLQTCLNQFEVLMRARWRLIEEAHGSISTPFYTVLTLWLVIIFAGFGLSAPGNTLSMVTIALGALSIASVIFVILDLDTPFTGLFTISSDPLRDALYQLSR